MVFQNLWYYITGYLELTVKGIAIEKFVNLALQRGALVWDIKYYNNSLKLKTRIQDFYLMRHVARNTGCRVSLIKKQGLPFIINRLKKRKMLILGGTIFVMILFYLSTFIWFVDIKGNERISEDEIVTLAERVGIEAGVKKNQLDIQELEEKLAARHDEIIWTGIEIRGAQIVIEVVEKDKPEYEVPQGATNMVAKKDARILDILVFSGYPLVEEGDVVKSGEQLIIGRVIPSSDNEKELTEEDLSDYPRTQAKGYVIGQVDYTGYGEAEIVTEKRSRTGESLTRYGVKYDGSARFFDLRENPFVHYDKVKTIRTIKLPKPEVEIEFVRERYYEVDKTQVDRCREKAVEIAKDKALADVDERIPDDGDIQNIDFKLIETADNNLVRLKALLQVRERIDTEKELN